MNISYQHLLFCPGPVNVAKNVKKAAISYEIGHREPEFEQLFERVQQKLLTFFEIRKKQEYTPIIITGSGSAANEAVLSSIVGNKKILVLSNGEFGERLYNTSKHYNKNTKILRFAWGEVMNISAIEAYLKKNKVDIIAMVHHETCSGMRNPIHTVGMLTKKYHQTFFVDAVSSAGVEKIDMEKWNIAFCSTSSSKAIASLSGISIVIGKNTEFALLKHIPAKTIYLNLYAFYEYATKKYQTPNTPAVPLFFALEKALDNANHKGISVIRQEIKERAVFLRKEMKKYGFRFLIDEKHMSSMLTSVLIPSTISITTLRERLHKKGIIIYNGKGPFEGKLFQVANIGVIANKDIRFFLQVLKTIMSESKYVDVVFNKHVNRISDNIPAFSNTPFVLALNKNSTKKTSTKKNHSTPFH